MLLAAFLAFIPANRAGSADYSMVQMFEPDEAAPLPYVLHMISPQDTLEKAVRQFIVYDNYYYGFPFFASSALTLLPLRWLGQLENLPLVMALLRQGVSVLPLLLGLLLLVYLQDGFRTYRSPLLYAFLLVFPAAVRNNLWWHPDGLTFLSAMLVLTFLSRDSLRFGLDFLLAAAFAGLTTAIKMVGLYFFLAVALVLVVGWVQGKVPRRRLVGMAAAFLVVMAACFIVSNPFLLSDWARPAYLATLQRQSELLTQGYAVVYARGLSAAWPTMRQYYGSVLLLTAALLCAVWSALRGPRRLLAGLILAWFLPLTVMVLWVSHFKVQYWLPVALPLYSCLVGALPENLRIPIPGQPKTWLPVLLLGLVAAQGVAFMQADIGSYRAWLQREEGNARIEFYDRVIQALDPLEGIPIRVYYDYRLYLPAQPGWTTETTYDLLDYGLVQAKDYDVLVLLEQRLQDYLNPDVTAIDPQSFALSRSFYQDAERGQISGYQLVYRDGVGLIFVRTPLFGRLHP